MVRPRGGDAPDLAQPTRLTAGAIQRLACPPDKAQAFLRDAEGNGLRVRVTRTGAKSFVFEQSLRNATVHITIGSVDTWAIGQAQAEAKRLSLLVD